MTMHGQKLITFRVKYSNEIITGCPNYLELNKLKKVDPINGFQMPWT